jgi:hypothetical protein
MLTYRYNFLTHTLCSNIRLNKPIVDLTVSQGGRGYYFVASDGGIFSYGDARFHGSTGNMKLAAPVVTMTTSPTGYWLVAQNGGVFSFNSKFFGAAHTSNTVRIRSTHAGDGYLVLDAR